MEMARSLKSLAALAVGAFPIGSLDAQEPTWTKYANVQYGELHKGNQGASTNLVSLDVYVPDGLAPEEKLPLVIMFHGGGWREGNKTDAVVVENKIPFFTSNGFIFASANYELSPAVKYPDHVQDVAMAIAFLHDHAADYQIDPENITIMGHSAGAQLAALAATDGKFLKQAGSSTGIITRLIVLDGIYDLPYRLRTDDQNNKEAIHGAFGWNPITLRQASPALIIKKAPKTYTPPVLNFFSGNRSKIPSDIQFIENLRKNNIPAGGIICREFSHKDVDWYVGLEGSEMNQPILDFLAGADPQSLDGEIQKTPGPPPPGN